MVYGGAARRCDKPAPIAMAAHADDTNHHEEASRMLETALQQMDSIIAGTELELAGMLDSPSPTVTDPVTQAAERLRLAIGLSKKSASTPSETAMSEETCNFLLTWLAGNNNAGRKKTQNQMLDMLAKATHFNRNEIEALLLMFKRTLRPKTDKLDRGKFRDVLHNTFDMTDDMLMDRVFRVFDKDNDGLISSEEWVTGLSVLLRGTLQERIDYCFNVYDFNGDRSLARDEVYHLLKNSVMKNPQEEDPEEGVRDLIDLVMKKLDVNHDGFVCFYDYEATVKMEPLLLEVFGPCLPQQESLETFLTTFVEPKRTPGYEG